MGSSTGEKSSQVLRRGGGDLGNRTVRMKVKKLQRIVPGGQGLNPDRLFLRTADYIMLLRLKINVLETLSSQLHIP